MAERDALMPPGRWWGWGDPEKQLELSDAALALLREELGEASPRPRAELGEVVLPEPESLPPQIAALVGDEYVLTGAEHRLRRALGKSYPDLIRARSGTLDAAPDAAVLPGDTTEVGQLLELCSQERIAVVPFGGGTSVVGGVEALKGEHERVIALDPRRLRSVAVDDRSSTARLGPGLRGSEAEALLGARGFTIGHFPQSFEYATIGGFAATRSAGQASSGYGRFDEIVSAVAMSTPSGPLRTLATPHSAAGPALRELILGSEGTLGLITEVSVRVRPSPARRHYEGWIAENFEAGRELIRSLAQADALPDVVRLSDETETRISLGLSGAGKLQKAALGAYLRLRSRAAGCLMICGWEGSADDVDRRRAGSLRLVRRAGAVALGTAPGRSWAKGRYEGPYLRDELIDRGYMVETLETSHTWSRLGELYRAVGSALSGAMSAQGTPGIVMCHVSHAYRDGASLYFTFLSRAREGAELETWHAVKRAACEAIVGCEATITHHHAVGRDHAPYMRAEIGEQGLEALRAIKGRLDPAAVMNPGKLLSG